MAGNGRKPKGTDVEVAEYDGSQPLPTAKREQYAQEYLVDLNQTQAAIRAGYAPGSAQTEGARLLRDAMVQRRVEWLQANRAARLGVDQERVIRELALIGFSDVTHYGVTEGGHIELREEAPDAATRALSSVKHRVTTRSGGKDGEDYEEETTELRLWDKPKALTLLGQHLGLFKETVEHRVSGGVTVTIQGGGVDLGRGE